MLKQSVCLLIFVISLYFSQSEGHPQDTYSHEESLMRVKRKYETFAEEDFKTYPELEETSLCENATLDAFFLYKDETGYAFRGPYFWKVVKGEIEKDYPLKICDHWKGLPDYLDAAFIYKEDQIFFFKGPKYWKFIGKKMDEGYPKYIKDGLPGIPEDIQAATAWGEKGFIYFFKGEYYWRYEPHCEHPVKKTYPKLIRDVFHGVPDCVDEALWHPNGYLYFFSGIRYYKFNDEKLRVEHEKEHYPMPSAPHWFGCKALA